MRDAPTWRIPIGIIGLMLGLLIYGVVLAVYLPGLIGTWPVLVQTVIYIVLGLIWLLPLRNFLIWMETGSWKAPEDGKDTAD